MVLCPALGYEALLSYLTMQDTAAQLAERTGAAVLHFDYDGTGDSAGTDEDPDRVAAWIRSVHHALDYAKGLSSEPGPLLVVALRAGALIAAAAAAERSDVSAFALWAPCATGKAFLREQRAFSQLQNAAAAGGAQAPAGVESNGFVFTEATVAALEALSLKTLAKPPAPELLVIQREDLRIANLFPKAFASDAAVRIEEQSTTDYKTMMEPPWLWEAPTQSIAVLADWVTRMTRDAKELAPPAAPSTKAATVEPGVTEQPLTFGANRFGILTTPAGNGHAATHAVVLVTSTFGYRIGPNRVNVQLARRLAREGVATFRIDVRGVGDSRDVLGAPPPLPYDTGAVEDVCDAVTTIESLGYRGLTLSGVCAGAFLAWAAAERIAERETKPMQLLLVNLEVFDPVPYDRKLMAAFENPPPGVKQQLQAAKTWPEKARVALPVVVKAAKIGGAALRASAPTRLLKDTLGARIHRIAKQGSRIDFVYSRGDQGLAHYKRRAALHHVRFLLRRIVNIEIIDGPDHSFTPRWAQNVLSDATSRALRDWTQSARG